MSAFYNFFKYFTYPLVSLVYPVKVVHKENMIYSKAVICCNHLDSSDCIIVASKLLKESCNVVGKAELFDSKFKAKFLTKLGAIPIKRGESDISACRKILQVLRDGKQLFIFPEGTRNTSGNTDIAEFKVGASLFAMKTNSPVVPLIIYEKLRPFHRNYLIVGKPIDLNAAFPENKHEDRELASEYLRGKMIELQNELKAYVAAKKGN